MNKRTTIPKFQEFVGKKETPKIEQVTDDNQALIIAGM